MAKSADFYTSVYAVVKQIPPGRVTSYGAIAKALGSPKSARMVGYALNGTRWNVKGIPAHRVVNRQGLLTGRHAFTPPELMAQLLEEEGVRIKNNAVVDFNACFWDPILLGEL